MARKGDDLFDICAHYYSYFKCVQIYFEFFALHRIHFVYLLKRNKTDKEQAMIASILIFDKWLEGTIMCISNEQNDFEIIPCMIGTIITNAINFRAATSISTLLSRYCWWWSEGSLTDNQFCQCLTISSQYRNDFYKVQTKKRKREALKEEREIKCVRVLLNVIFLKN